MALLEILRPKGHQNVALDGERLTIGKSDDNDLAIGEDPTVSRHHTLLEQRRRRLVDQRPQRQERHARERPAGDRHTGAQAR